MDKLRNLIKKYVSLRVSRFVLDGLKTAEKDIGKTNGSQKREYAIDWVLKKSKGLHLFRSLVSDLIDESFEQHSEQINNQIMTEYVRWPYANE